MSVLNRLAHFLNRRDEIPNQELARDLAAKRDKKGIREIAANLEHEHPGVRADCIKVLYEIGDLNPELIAPYVDEFLHLLSSKNNRLVWGGMSALATMAEFRPDVIFAGLPKVYAAMQKGSVITIDNGVQVLAKVASTNAGYQTRIFPFLLAHLKTCRPKEVPQHSEKCLVAVNAGNKAAFIRILEHRMPEFSVPQAARVKRVLKVAVALV